MSCPHTTDGFPFATLEGDLTSFAWVGLGHPSRWDPREVLRGQERPSGLEGVADGTRAGDLILTRCVELLLLSPRLVEFLHQSGLTGWAADVVVQIEGPPEVPTAQVLTVTGRSGPVVIPDIMEPEKEVRRSSWDGSDFFVAPNADFIFLSPRANQVLQECPLKNIRTYAEGLTVVDG